MIKVLNYSFVSSSPRPKFSKPTANAAESILDHSGLDLKYILNQPGLYERFIKNMIQRALVRTISTLSIYKQTYVWCNMH